MTLTDVEQRARLYRSSAWQSVRRAVLKRSPLCEPCLARGIRTNADTVDHKYGHGADWQIRFFSGPFTAMCSKCHGKKTAIERPVSGFRAGLAAAGTPVIGFGRRADRGGEGLRPFCLERSRPPPNPDASPNPGKRLSTAGAVDDK